MDADIAITKSVQMWKASDVSKTSKAAEDRLDRLKKIVPAVKDPFPQKAIPSSHIREDHYVEVVDSLIERDYFPDLPTLRLEHALILAERRGDTQAASQFRNRLAAMTPVTPLAAMTPVTPLAREQARDERLEVGLTDGSSRVLDLAKTTLDKFQARYTSEDNASFEQIIANDKARRREQEAWVEDEQRKHNLRVGSIRLSGEDGVQLKGQLQLTNHDARNPMFFNHKHDAPDTKQHARNVEVSVNRKNTRFSSATSSNKPMPPSTSARQGDHIGDVSAHQTAQRQGSGNGYTLMQTPVIDPASSGASPLMTYGSVVSTPLLLNEQVARTSGNTFKIPEAPTRDELAHKMAARAIRKETVTRRHQKTHAGNGRGGSALPTQRAAPQTAGDRLRQKMGLSASSGIGLTPGYVSRRPTTGHPLSANRSARPSSSVVDVSSITNQRKKRRTNSQNAVAARVSGTVHFEFQHIDIKNLKWCDFVSMTLKDSIVVIQ